MNLIKKGRRILVENGYTFVALKKNEIYNNIILIIVMITWCLISQIVIKTECVH